MPEQQILRMEGISKQFPGVKALDNVTLEVRAGEIHGFLGENGAGKSTLMKILSGVYTKDNGHIYLDGQEIEVRSPHQAQMLGITIIYQELNLMPNLTVAENVYLGREPNTARFVNWRQLHEQTRELTDRLGIHIAPTTTVRELSVAQQQMIEIARALSVKSRVIIMDEPTSALTADEVDHLFRIMRDLKANGIGVIFISHRLDEVFAICDRITVLRDGANVGTVDIKDATPEMIIRMMVGRSVTEFFAKSEAEVGRVVLEVRHLSRARPEGGGNALFDTVNNPRDAIRAGMGFVPEDRKLQALFLAMSVEENASMASLGNVANLGFINGGARRNTVSQYVHQLSVRLASLDQRVIDLSGGNQQKVVITRWLALKPRILIMDEPTRGIDVGAKAEVHALISQLAKDGVAIIMISSELPEVLGMSDRVLIMHEGHKVGELSRDEATPEHVMTLMTGEQAITSTP